MINICNLCAYNPKVPYDACLECSGHPRLKDNFKQKKLKPLQTVVEGNNFKPYVTHRRYGKV